MSKANSRLQRIAIRDIEIAIRNAHNLGLSLFLSVESQDIYIATIPNPEDIHEYPSINASTARVTWR